MLLNEDTLFHSAVLTNGDTMPGPIRLSRIDGDAALFATNEELAVPITSVIYLRVREIDLPTLIGPLAEGAN